MRARSAVLGFVVLSVAAACGGDDRSFSGSTGGTGGAAGGSAATGGSATGGAGGGSATGGTTSGGGSAGAGGATGGSGGVSGSGGASGGGGATGGAAGSGGATGGSGGATGGSGGATGGSGGATGGSGGVAACDTTKNICAETPPGGWTGPLALYKGAGAPPGCPGSYPTKISDGKTGFNPGIPSCACSCDPATGIGCGGVAAAVYDVPNNLAGCTVNPTGYTKVWSANAGVCTKASASAVGQVALWLGPPTSAGTCAPKSNHVLPTPTFSDQTRLCTGATAVAGSCGTGQTCMPQPFKPFDVCVYHSGNLACPSAYPQKTVVFDGYQDTRSCSACSCGNATSSCKGMVQFASTCSSGGIAYGAVSGCGTPSPDIAATQYGTYVPNPSGTCPASSSTLTGTAVPTGETTVCCK